MRRAPVYTLKPPFPEWRGFRESHRPKRSPGNCFCKASGTSGGCLLGPSLHQACLVSFLIKAQSDLSTVTQPVGAPDQRPDHQRDSVPCPLTCFINLSSCSEPRKEAAKVASANPSCLAPPTFLFPPSLLFRSPTPPLPPPHSSDCERLTPLVDATRRS